MKVLHTADWHIGQFKGPVEDGVNLRSLDTVKCLEYMVEKAREEHPDLVCISGDVFHQEQIGPVRYSDEMVTATRIIDELSKVSKFVVVMRGTPNHDGFGQFRVLTKMLEHNKKVAVVTTPQVISKFVMENGVAKTLISRAKEKLEKELNDAKDKNFADPVIKYLLKRCEEDDGLSSDVLQPHKTWAKRTNACSDTR